MRSPFSAKDTATDIVHPVDRWVLKIQKLLAVHMMHLVDSPMKWVVRISGTGPVQLYPGAPVQT